MAERLTLKKLSDELEQLRTQMQEMETEIERKIASRLESTLAAAAPATKSASASVPPTGINAGQRLRMITHEAYLIAEQRGFQGGDPAQDWIEAEKLVDYRLMQQDETGQTASSAAKPPKKPLRSAKKPGTGKKAGAKSSNPAKS